MRVFAPRIELARARARYPFYYFHELRSDT
jgi:hypothetical protein